MIIKEYERYYRKLIEYSKKFIEKNCSFRGSFEKVINGQADVHFNYDYKYYAFTKGTKSLISICKLLEIGSYEDAIIISRTIFECYLSQRYLDEKFDLKTLKDMVVIPTGIFQGILNHNDGIVKRADSGEQIEFEQRNPNELSVGKDRDYFYYLYYTMCLIAHSNISQAWSFLDSENHFTLSGTGLEKLSHLIALFVFSKLYESIALLENVSFENTEEEKEQTSFFENLTIFLYEQMDTMLNIPASNPNYPGKIAQKAFKDMKKSLKEQLGRVDKNFVGELEKQNIETPIEKTLKQALLEMENPSEYFESMRKNGELEKKFQKLSKLIGLQQNPVYHPEGDVWTHTMQALDRAAGYRDKVSDPYAFMLLVLCHDIGKISSTKEINGVIHSYGHEETGVEPAIQMLKRFTNNVKVRKYVADRIPLHMKASLYAREKSSVKATNKLFDAVENPLDLIYFSMSDKDLSEEDKQFLFDRYKLYLDSLA